MSTALLFLIFGITRFAADPYPRQPAVDILHYTFRVDLNDSTNIITGQADVSVRFREPASGFHLNLTNKNADGRGMEVFAVRSSGKPVEYRHNSDQLSIESASAFKKNDTVSFTIAYRGEPIDGLVIGKNKFGDRTFFGDNWPDRGRNWLPVIDHPSDKAKVDFIITAPAHYEVIATGALVGVKSISANKNEHHWKESVDVPVKVITIAAAEFSVKQLDVIDNIPISTWVFPQNERAGFDDFAVAPRVFRFMQAYIGPYPYEKLAHVQSKTRFGGLENASNIFYFENSVNGKNEREGLIAHETAHQWFGNSITENDWYHVWLSEGFATYLAALYLGSTDTPERLAREMSEAREDVIKATRKKPGAIIDTTLSDINQVLNTNTYQKASWFLHMLHHRLGESNFQKGIQEYFRVFRDGNVVTTDFLAVMERVSGQELDEFFSTWLYHRGLPRLSGQWTYNKKRKSVDLVVNSAGFRLPQGTKVEVGLQLPDGKTRVVEYSLSGANRRLEVPVDQKPISVVLDPRVMLLFEGEIKEKP